MKMVAGIILAAGTSSRMGSNKLLLKLAKKNILLYSVEAALDSNLQDIIVVTGYQTRQIQALLAELPVKTVFNSQYAQGQSTSVIKGIKEVDSAAEGVMFILGDQPFLTSKTIDILLDYFNEKDSPSIIVPYYNGKRGNPVIFHRQFFSEIMLLTGDEGARSVILNNLDKVVKVELTSSEVVRDIDTPEDFKKLLSRK